MRLDNVVDLAFETLDRRAKNAEYFEDPVAWAKDILGITLWSKQAAVAMSLVTDKNTVVKAGHEVGKSFLAGLLICWWIDTRWDLPGGCFVVSTAPSTRQINAIVWNEARKMWARHNRRYKDGLVGHAPVGYITADAHWRLSSGIELGYGAKPPEGKEDSMSGIHARYVLAIGDEAVGLSKGLIGDLANITSNATSRRFLICNPTNPLSYVAEIFKNEYDSWSRHTISVFDSPNFHGRGVCDPEYCDLIEEHSKMEPGEGLPVEALESLVDQSYIDGIVEEHGLNSPTYMSRVLGEFAWDMGFTLIRPEDVAKGEDVEIVPSLETLPRLGVDFSRSKSGDKNTVYSYHDGKLRFVADWSEPNAVRTAERVHELALEMAVGQVRGDGQGLGGPIIDMISEMSQGKYEVISIDSSFTSPDIVKWYNWRAYMYWHFQNELSLGHIDLDGDDEKLVEQLLGVEIKKRLTGRDNLLLESKEEMRKRGIHSPDHADAAVYATVDMSWLTGNPLGQAKAGDVIVMDPYEFLGLNREGAGLPG